MSSRKILTWKVVRRWIRLRIGMDPLWLLCVVAVTVLGETWIAMIGAR